jgi:3',5'-cyclic AMP phosphodiesterase CpdA
MSLSIHFAIFSDPHIALPHTIWDNPNRFHQVEISISALEHVFTQLEPLDLDFLLIPGDLTQHGELDNHQWLAERLRQLPYPVYVVPGNHDILHPQANLARLEPHRDHTAGIPDFTACYRDFGYGDRTQPYYCCELHPGVRLIGLNSIAFDETGQQTPMGRIDEAQLRWLEQVLRRSGDDTRLVMVHHNVIEHLPNQSQHVLGRRYVLENASELLSMLHQAGVRLIFTGHLHVQDVAEWKGIYEITTGSLVSYPHPYRILSYHVDANGTARLEFETFKVERVPDCPDLQHWSRTWIGDRSFAFMVKLLTHPPLNLELAQAEAIAPRLRYLWADIAHGDMHVDIPELPTESKTYLQQFGAVDAAGNFLGIDNQARLCL